MAVEARRWMVSAAAMLFVAAPHDAAAWRSREHRAIGMEAYKAACERLAPHRTRDAATALRYEIACGNLPVQALLYGQATGVSGDFTAEPGDMTTTSGAALATQRGNYYRLALTNSTHFHPRATREWREFHQRAVAGAIAAARVQGVAQLAAFEQAFYDSAFGDHFLQDAFAAGHMGFNRPGSSAAASKVFHDEWNERGRWVKNRRGDVWKTYGDGLLDTPESRDARTHLLRASTESVYAVLAAFVLAAYDPAPEVVVWSELPYAIEDQELLPDLETMFAGSPTLSRPELLPLLAVKRPAVKDSILGAWSIMTTAFEDADNPSGALVVGGDLLVPRLGLRLEAGAGVGFDEGFDLPSLAIDASIVRALGLGIDGLISHEIAAGTLLLIGGDFDITLHLGYRMNLEAGDWLLRVDVAPAFDLDDPAFGLYAAFGIARVMGSAGGGGFF